MKKSIRVCGYLVVFAIFCKTAIAQTSYYQASVYFKSGVTRNITPTDTSATVTASDIQTVLTRYSIAATSVYPEFPKFIETDTLKITTSKGGTQDSLKQMDKAKVFAITVSDTTTLKNLITDLLALPEVVFAEANGSNKNDIVPNDPIFPNQWNLNNTVNPGKDIHAEAAWDIFTGSANNIIAIIDDGVDVSHQDLSAKIAGGDNTYHVETSGSFSFSHGTFVAGIAGASSNNGIGVTGVDWNAKLISKDKYDYWNCVCINYFKKQHGDGLLNQKISEAVDFSPNVWTLNESWGLDPATRYSVLVREAFAYAYKNNRVSSVAAGNSGAYTPVNSPAGFNTGLIAVGQTDNNDVTLITSFGPWMDVVAPGQNIYTTNYNNAYTYNSGTSLAAPQVAGLASLMKGYNSSLNNDDIEQIIKLSTDYNGTTPPYDQLNGYGRINAYKALKFLQAPYQLQQLTAGGGTVYATSGNMKLVMLGIKRLADAAYVGKRIEVRTTVNLATGFCSNLSVWGTGFKTTGFRDDGAYCYGEGFCEVVPGSQTSTQVTLRTYVYQLYDILGNFLGYYPRAPQYVTFSYSILGVQQPIVNGDNLVCGATSNPYTITNLPANATVAWSATPTGVVQINSPTANSTTITKLASGQITLNAAITNGCGLNQNYTAPKAVSIGGPYVGINYSPYGSCNGSTQAWQLSASPTADGTNWHWTVGHLGNNSSIYITNPYSNSTFADVIGGGTVNLSYNDLCGVAQQNGVTLYSNCHSLAIIAPNPSTGMVTISTTATSQAQSDATSTISAQWKIYKLKVLGQSGNQLKALSYPDGVTSTNINLTSLPNGTYTLQLYDKVSWTSQQIAILR